MHTVAIEKVSDSEMAEHLEARIEQIHAPAEIQVDFKDGKPVFEDNPEHVEKVKYETERAQEGWIASCNCGWQANNPLPSKEAAQEAADDHYDVINRLQPVGGNVDG